VPSLSEPFSVPFCLFVEHIALELFAVLLHANYGKKYSAFLFCIFVEHIALELFAVLLHSNYGKKYSAFPFYFTCKVKPTLFLFSFSSPHLALVPCAVFQKSDLIKKKLFRGQHL
jgi:general stress protein CsbA